MQLTVLLFARVREIVGADSVTLEWPPGATVGELRCRLAAEYPALVGILERSAVAVNQDFADPARELRPGDEVAILPPVSGG